MSLERRLVAQHGDTSVLRSPPRADADVRGDVEVSQEHHPPTIRRTRLIRRLTESQRCRIVLVRAGAGYGKSTLMDQWCSTIAGRPVVRIALTEIDDSVHRFGLRLVNALSAQIDLPIAIQRLASASSPDWLRTILPNLIDALADTDVTLVIDDVHELTSADAVQVLQGLCRLWPSRGQLVLVGRSMEHLRLARLLSDNSTLILDEGDLTFDRDEMGSLLDHGGRPITVDRALAQTGGWPTGVRFAYLASGGNSAAQRTSWSVGDYIDEELLSDLSAAELELIEDIAAIEPVTSSALQRILARDDVGWMVTSLIGKRLPMVLTTKVAGDIEIRLHALLRDHLLGHLERRDPNRRVRLAKRAAAMCRDAGDLDRAFQYLTRIGDKKRTAIFVFAQCSPLVMNGDSATVRRWLNHFTVADATEDPIIAICELVLLSAEGDLRTLPFWLELADRPDVGPMPDGSANASVIAHRLRNAFGFEPYAGPERVDEVGRFDAFWVAELLGKSVKARAHGHPAEAEQMLRIIAPAAAQFGYMNALRLGMLAELAAEAGRWSDGQPLLDAALYELERHRLFDNPMVFSVDATHAWYAMHAGDSARAARQLAIARRKMIDLGDGGRMRRLMAVIVLTRVSTWLGDLGLAKLLGLEATRLVRDRYPTANGTALQLSEVLSRLRTGDPTPTAVGETLTASEMRVLSYLRSHLTIPEIAGALHRSPNTVKTQTHSVYQKLGASTRSEAVATARSLGLLLD